MENGCVYGRDTREMLKELKKDRQEVVREFKANTGAAMQRIDDELRGVNNKFDNHLYSLGKDLAKKNKLLIGGLFAIILFILIPDEYKLASLQSIIKFLF